MAKKVYVGMSGGVDSSVAAALLKAQGYDVSGVYMKNWSKDLPGMACPWEQDYKDAKRVAVQLDIPFTIYDFEKDYRQIVVDYMTREYQAGNTPNPDIMCNQEIKFKLFLETALSNGADFVATGHYARLKEGELWTGIDTQKDQSYFLYSVSKQALKQTLMPLGDYTKPQIRAIAQQLGLVTADKKDSQGICFVGKIGIRDFLFSEVGPQPFGNIIDQDYRIIGQHDGALFYTIGQRHGLDVGGGLPYYVAGKDMTKNEVYVTTNLDDSRLWRKQLKLINTHWINQVPVGTKQYQVRTRYRAALIKTKSFKKLAQNSWQFILSNEIRAVTPGQSAVIYDGERCLGGGILV